MKNQNIQPLHKREYKPKREPIPRTWFLSHGYTKADTRYTNGHAIWLHPRTNDVFSAYRKIKLNLLPKERHLKTSAQYLYVPREFGSILLARLKYMVFKGLIPPRYTIRWQPSQQRHPQSPCRAACYQRPRWWFPTQTPQPRHQRCHVPRHHPRRLRADGRMESLA